MFSGTIHTFNDPEAYHAAIRASRVSGVATGRGPFRAELVRIDFDKLWMQRASESSSRVMYIENTPRRVAAIFFAPPGQSTMRASGVPLAAGQIIAWNTDVATHHSAAAACRWDAMSLSLEDFSAYSEAILGRPLSPPREPVRVQPPVALAVRLTGLHTAAAHLAKTAPDILASPGAMTVTQAATQ